MSLKGSESGLGDCCRESHPAIGRHLNCSGRYGGRPSPQRQDCCPILGGQSQSSPRLVFILTGRGDTVGKTAIKITLAGSAPGSESDTWMTGGLSFQVWETEHGFPTGGGGSGAHHFPCQGVPGRGTPSPSPDSSGNISCFDTQVMCLLKALALRQADVGGHEQVASTLTTRCPGVLSTGPPTALLFPSSVCWVFPCAVPSPT